ncbi:hypothetical protein CY34DRAFT_26883 [Suillus luteus UH-Slu-Lm8-n1]|uniref:Unplaced genomic scaffold CY34scaffold_641, whole genome shotgun sequence n=1 Tax=Suillus luteus UH-Slu-Lm8-n1 TaxID=930992 RepID=A0A0D0AQQ1_9AGAM|nr:hypothetical protein CY34DRAFT_26883 [Suillus luteus UH-Slu-Lm8-n1]
MLTYARETWHEKIIHGLAMGLAFIFYGRREEADSMITSLLTVKDPILRYGGVYTLALANAGTSNNDAVWQLPHTAVLDTSVDNPGQVPRIVQLLSESYNPHVRCGATLALGIACAGTSLQDAVDILEPMTKDNIGFMRQSAFIALGMILVRQSEPSSPSMSSTRALYTKVMSNKHEDPTARLMDAGGRNVTISLQSRVGSKNMNAIVGMAIFCQIWYWYPLVHCMCLMFEPTAIIGLNEDEARIQVPKFEFVSSARPSLFAYPPPATPLKRETPAKAATTVLSTTAKVKAREKKKQLQMQTLWIWYASLSLDGLSSTNTSEDIELKRKSEPSSENVVNFSRVTPMQLACISFPLEGWYQPVHLYH